MRRWEVAYESLKTKEKSSSVIPKVATVAVAYGSSRLRELFITKYLKVLVTIQTGFHRKSGRN